MDILVAVLGLLIAVAMPLLSPGITEWLAGRPVTIAVPDDDTDDEEEVSSVMGFNRAHNYVVADEPPVDRGHRRVHDAAAARFGKTIVRYETMVDWLGAGARGSSGRRTIDRASSRRLHGLANHLIGRVFTVHSTRTADD